MGLRIQFANQKLANMGFLDKMRNTVRTVGDENNEKEKVDELQGALNDRERELNAAKAELDRMKLTDQTASMGSDERLQKYKQAVKQRDERIQDLKAEVENVKQKMSKELAAVNQKMAFIMDDKDHQIKRLNALGGETSENDNVRRAIAAEANCHKQVDPNKLPKIPKNQAEADLIKEALLGNTFMWNLAPGVLFGELAILYNCRRTASIKCKSDVSLWAMERSIFQAVVKSAGQAKDEEWFNLLKKVKDSNQFAEAKLRKIADCLEEETFEAGSLIFKQGASGDFFYVIQSGEVDITKNNSNGGEDPVVVLTAGEFFGEKALVKEDKRNANAKAKTDVKCYTLDRKAFVTLVGSVADQDKEEVQKTDTGPVRQTNDHIVTAKFSDLTIIKPLGAGGFGLVKLVKVKGIEDRAYALKCIQKHRVVQYGQQRHIMDEKNILAIME